MQKNTIKFKKFTNKEKGIFISLIILSLFPPIQYFVGIGVLSPVAVYFFGVISYGFTISYFFWNKSSVIKLKNAYEKFYILWFLVILCMTILSLIIEGRVSRSLYSLAIYLQILMALFYADLKIEILQYFFYILSIITLIIILFVLSKTTINLEYALRRGYIYEPIFYYIPLFWYAPGFLILSYLLNKHIKWSMFIFVITVTLNLLILKRYIFVEVFSVGIVLSLIIISRKNKVKQVFKILIILIFLVLMLYSFAGEKINLLLGATIQRTKDVAGDMGEFDRFVEFKTWFKESNVLEIIIGGGAGATHEGLGGIADALHVGWFDFILKGGIPLLLLVIIPYLKIIKKFGKISTFSIKQQFSIYYLIYYFPMLIFTNLYAIMPLMFIFYYACINTMVNERRREK